MGAVREQRARYTRKTKVVFHNGKTQSELVARSLAHISLPLLYNPHLNALEEHPELKLTVGTLIAQRYRVVAQVTSL